jgi:hypothetical protein
MLAGFDLQEPTLVLLWGIQRAGKHGPVGPERHGPTGNRGVPHSTKGAPSPLYSHDTDEALHQETNLHFGTTPLQTTSGHPRIHCDSFLG